jgi:hypothetical protein
LAEISDLRMTTAALTRERRSLSSAVNFKGLVCQQAELLDALSAEAGYIPSGSGPVKFGSKTMFGNTCFPPATEGVCRPVSFKGRQVLSYRAFEYLTCKNVIHPFGQRACEVMVQTMFGNTCFPPATEGVCRPVSFKGGQVLSNRAFEYLTCRNVIHPFGQRACEIWFKNHVWEHVLPARDRRSLSACEFQGASSAII